MSPKEWATAFKEAIHLLFFSQAHGAKKRGRGALKRLVTREVALIDAIAEALRAAGQTVRLAKGEADYLIAQEISEARAALVITIDSESLGVANASR